MSAVMFGQTFYGSLVGSVTDAPGVGVSGAAVTATNNSTGERRTAKTDSDGAYRRVNLIPGRYKVEIEQPGLKRYTRDQIDLTVASVIRADVSLAVRDVTQWWRYQPMLLSCKGETRHSARDRSSP
jgi:hypothetical protein